jgi:two-component system chemotaxis response regulator CheB
MALKQRGGVTIVQDPAEALYSGMPQSAIENVDIDYIRRVADIAAILAQLANQPVAQEGEQAGSEEMEMEADMAELELGAMQNPARPGTPSPFGCPECGGVLWELDDEKLIRFRCRTGHAFSPSTLLAQQSHDLEEALWNALRALEEKAALSERLALQAQERQRHISSQRFAQQALAARQQATLVRQLLLQGENNGKLSTVNDI